MRTQWRKEQDFGHRLRYMGITMEKLMSGLGLGNIIKEPVCVNGGLLHKMYHVTTTDGEYAIKVLNPEIMKPAFSG